MLFLYKFLYKLLTITILYNLYTVQWWCLIDHDPIHEVLVQIWAYLSLRLPNQARLTLVLIIDVCQYQFNINRCHAIIK